MLLDQFNCDYPVELIHGCAHQFLKDYAYQGRELIYCDPTYLQTTRTSSRRYRFDYENQDHVALLELLKDLPCPVILFGYPSALYDEALSDWQTLELQVMNQGCLHTEKLWFNFRPGRVHWARYAGKNTTDQQHIKCKAENWGRRYNELPYGVRTAVLAAILAVETGKSPSDVYCQAGISTHRILRYSASF